MTEAQLRNLKQYQQAPIEEIEAVIQGIKIDFEDERRIQEYIDRISEQYELVDETENDRSALRDLATISIRIEDFDRRLKMESSAESPDWGEIKWIVDILTDLRKSRQQIEDTLNITRKARQNAEQTSVVDAIENYKQRAKRILEERMSYIYCPKCKLLVGNVWMLSPKSGNSFTFTCPRDLGEGKTCGNKFTVTGTELIEKKNKNLVEMLDV